LHGDPDFRRERASRDLSSLAIRHFNVDGPIVETPQVDAPLSKPRIYRNMGFGSARSGSSTTFSGATIEVLAIVAKSQGRGMARTIQKSGMKEVPLSEIKDDLSRYLREAGRQEIVITRHGKPAGVLIGFESEEDWFDYRLEHDPRFLRRIEQARSSLRAGGGVRLEDVGKE
jgi:prevent-host-death family protein